MYLSELLIKPSIVAAILGRRRLRAGFREIYRKFRPYTMIHEAMFVDNLELLRQARNHARVRGRVRSVARGDDRRDGAGARRQS